ncbi:MAG: hypothetical protein M4D85_00805 [Actinomycetota bacterium]|nr:hypothetical protein [Actinomycetota bacterium]MDQ3663749.1 hypothetical protein [Actinomycetota bacterium]
MSRRVAGWLAWSLCSAVCVLHVVGWTFTLRTDHVTPVFDLVSSAALIVLPVVGALIASRHPGNAIGWLFCGAGILLAIAGATYGYAGYALTGDRNLPGGVASAWLSSWVFLPAVFGIPQLLFLLFPDGRPLSRRWGWAVWFTGISLTCQAIAAAAAPGPMEDAPVPGVHNPLGATSGLVRAIELVGWTGALSAVVVATWALVLRYRRSHGDQRLQLRWFAFSASLFLLACVISTALFQTRYVALGQALILVAFNAIPIAAGVAILRHRLYDIDVVINRTLVYGALTVTLAASYLGTVIVLQLVLEPLTVESDLAVAGSTLAVAALFRPARARIQAAVDRRFYRSRYDATRTLDIFAGRLRNEVDLEAVGADLRATVSDAVQPAHVSLWIRS